MIISKSIRRFGWLMLLVLLASTASAQPRFSQPHGFYSVVRLTISIESSDAEAEIRYTTDCSEPTADSRLYTGPITIAVTTIIRAVEVKDGVLSSDVTTASYIFQRSVLSQRQPSAYPSQWGSYTQIYGTAPADYDMDPEMTSDPDLRQKIQKGLSELPILSISTDKDNLFSHERDSVRGGIYIFTGPPVGDNTGNGWTRPASVELMGGPQAHDLTTTCGLRLHGGHGRLAEKNPKHSFRLVFKKQYGPSTLNYPVFGDNRSQTFDQLVLRCHFGNSWQHWSESARQKAQYSRDVWARCMQGRLGRTNDAALYVHLFLNGLYWGIYNIAERIDDQFGKAYLGGKKSDIDVVKIEEEGGSHLEASEGDLQAWKKMVAMVKEAATDDDAYYLLQGKGSGGSPDAVGEVLLDIDAFIDYMLINQYAGNNDWAHHNWYALRRVGSESQGFRFICWDTEQIFEGSKDNVLSLNNGDNSPTGIFQYLLRNHIFKKRYAGRAKQLLSDDGLLGPASVTELWDSLYNTIAIALYDEAARWGDYRRDVHPYQTQGKLYTVDGYYMTERQRLIGSYFPQRTARVANDIRSLVGQSVWEEAEEWSDIDETMAVTAVTRRRGIYNLNGQRITAPRKGIYIKDGKIIKL